MQLRNYPEPPGPPGPIQKNRALRCLSIGYVDGSVVHGEAVDANRVDEVVSKLEARKTPEQEVVVTTPEEEINRRTNSEGNVNELPEENTKPGRNDNNAGRSGRSDSDGGVLQGQRAETPAARESIDLNTDSGREGRGAENDTDTRPQGSRENESRGTATRPGDSGADRDARSPEIAGFIRDSTTITKALDSAANGTGKLAKRARRVKLRTRQIMAESGVPFRRAQALAFNEFIAEGDRSVDDVLTIAINVFISWRL